MYTVSGLFVVIIFHLCCGFMDCRLGIFVLNGYANEVVL